MSYTYMVTSSVNVDGAVDMESKAAAVGGVICGDQGEWLFGFCHSLGSCSVVNVELWAILEEFRHAWRMKFNRVDVETDCRDIVISVTGNVISSFGNTLISKIHGVLRKDWEVVICHISRGANVVADLLARHLLGQSPREELHFCALMWCQALLTTDLQNVVGVG
ncbi:hypothetical protein GQ457_16G031070 [Hibiscus cannabinus]